MSTLIKNGTLVTASDVFSADLLVEQGTISAIGRQLSAPGAQLIDAQGLYVMPGGVDVHTHLELPVMGTVAADDWASGTRAAAQGGTTTLIDFVTPARGEPLPVALASWQVKAGQAAIDYGLHLSVVELGPDTLAQLTALVAQGLPSIKIYLDYPGLLQLDDREVLQLLRWAAGQPVLIQVHAVNGLASAALIEEAAAAGQLAPVDHGRCRPPELEGEATARVLALAQLVSCPIYIVHVSCRQALEAIRLARQRGQTVFAETCPHYLYLTEERLASPGFEGAKYVCNPPLRAPEHAAALWQALADGTIQTVATDHCPFNFAGQKELGRGDFRRIPNGLPGIESRLVLLYQAVREGRLSLCRFVELVATAPARIFGLYPRKGSLAVGADADLVLWDPQLLVDLSAVAQQMRVDYSLYEGWRLQGGPRTVLSRGELIVDGGSWQGSAGRGRFLPRFLGTEP